MDKNTLNKETIKDIITYLQLLRNMFEEPIKQNKVNIIQKKAINMNIKKIETLIKKLEELSP